MVNNLSLSSSYCWIVEETLWSSAEHPSFVHEFMNYPRPFLSIFPFWEKKLNQLVKISLGLGNIYPFLSISSAWGTNGVGCSVTLIFSPLFILNSYKVRPFCTFFMTLLLLLYKLIALYYVLHNFAISTFNSKTVLLLYI